MATERETSTTDPTSKSSRAKDVPSLAEPIRNLMSFFSDLWIRGLLLHRAVAVRELSLHDTGLPSVLRSPDRKRHTSHHAMASGCSPARLERRHSPGSRGGLETHSRPG